MKKITATKQQSLTAGNRRYYEESKEDIFDKTITYAVFYRENCCERGMEFFFWRRNPKKERDFFGKEYVLKKTTVPYPKNHYDTTGFLEMVMISPKTKVQFLSEGVIRITFFQKERRWIGYSLSFLIIVVLPLLLFY